MATQRPQDEFDVLRAIVELLNGLESAEQRRILKWACEKLGIDLGVADLTPRASARNPEAPAPLGNVVTPTDIKSFVTEKNPGSDNQFAAVTAYFHRFLASSPKETISGTDLQEAARLAGRARLKNPAKTLNNATSAGLLDKAGGGSYRINTVGENLVALVLSGEGKPARSPARRSRKPAKQGKKTARK